MNITFCLLLEIVREKRETFSLGKCQKILRQHFHEKCKIECLRELCKTIKIYFNKRDRNQIKIVVSLASSLKISIDTFKRIEFILLQQDCDASLKKTKILSLFEDIYYFNNGILGINEVVYLLI